MVSTGETVLREEPLQGGILTRVASSHIRIGTFEFFFFKKDFSSLKKLADYSIKRHFGKKNKHRPYEYFFKSVIAVFSPTPGNPGILSEGSPFKAKYSMYCEGVISYFSLKDFSSIVSVSDIPFFV